MRRVLATIPLLALGCGTPPAPPPPTVSAPRAAQPDRVAYLDDRPIPGDETLVSPDDRRAARTVTLVPGGTPAIAVHDLSPERKGAVVRLVALGEKAEPRAFLDARRLLVRIVPDRVAVIDVDTGEARHFPSAAEPAASRGMLGTVERSGEIVIRDAATLAVRARAGGLAGVAGRAELSFPAPSRLLITLYGRALLLDTATLAVLHDGPDFDVQWTRPRTSLSGRYFAATRAVGDAAEIVILDTQKPGNPIGTAPRTVSVTAFAFAPDERTLISASDPAFLHITDLATKRTRKIRVGPDGPGDELTQATRQLGLGENGLVCGHLDAPASTYGSCHNEIAFDLRTNKPRTAPGSLSYCFIEGESARWITLPKDIAGAGRKLLPTWSTVCNEALSPDGATFAVADSKPWNRRDPFEDVELLLVDVRSRALRHRVPLGSIATDAVGRATFGAEFSPDGRWLQVEHGEELFTVIDVARGAALPNRWSGGRFGAASSVLVGGRRPTRVFSLVTQETWVLGVRWPEIDRDDAPGAAEAASAVARGAFIAEKAKGRVRVYRSASAPDRATTLVVMGKDAVVGFLPDGRFELMGKEADLRRAAEGLACLSGSTVAPLASCAERHRASGEWRRVFAGE